MAEPILLLPVFLLATIKRTLLQDDEHVLCILDVVQQLHIEVIPPHLFKVEECGVATRGQPVIQVVRCRQALPLVTYEYVVIFHLFYNAIANLLLYKTLTDTQKYGTAFILILSKPRSTIGTELR